MPTRILLVEDNPADAQFISHLLKETPLLDPRIEHVDRVSKALESVESGSPDVVLLDLSLPDSNPDTTFQTVFAKAPSVPVIVLTGIDDSERSLRAVRGGAQDYLIKQRVDEDRLVRAIRYAIERKRYARALRESEERYALAVQGANDGIWDWDLRSDRLYYSPRWLGMLGLELEKVASSPDTWLERIHPDDADAVHDNLRRHLKGKTEFFQSEHRLRHQSGRYLWFLSRGLAIRDRDGRPLRMAGSLTDVTERRRIEQQLLRDAFYDSLTGLPNRPLFLDRLGVSIARALRNPDYIFAVLFMDLDGFKNVNDSLGHLVGDQLLTAVAQRLIPTLRQGDTFARLGGDEFAVLLEDIGQKETVHQVAERLIDQFSNPFELGGGEVYTSASVGIAIGSARYTRAEDLLRDSDIAMYRAKREGKGRCAVFDSSIDARAVTHYQLEGELKRAVDQQEFCLHFQPIIELDRGCITGFEALVRWQHPERGLIEPKTFIPLAEQCGWIVPISDIVLAGACGQMVDWQKRFPGLESLSISVNLSGRELRQGNLVERVTKVLTQTGLPPRCLRLELTETMIMENTPSAWEKLRQLRELEIEIHIDDFGTGYSSLNYLHQLPASVVKIDRSFVRQLGENRNHEKIVGTIIYLAHNLGLNVLAEGLESAEDLDYLRRLNCQYGQGFYFSKPLEGPDAERLLASDPHW